MFPKQTEDFLHRHLRGSFLLASPRLPEGDFYRSVVWLTEFSKRGAAGYILSNPAGTTLGASSVVFAGTPMQTIPLMFGGPVNPEEISVFALDEDSLSGQIKTHIIREQDGFKTASFSVGAVLLALAGTAQWAPGQLEKELEHNAWITLPADFLTARKFFKEMISSVRNGSETDFRGVLWSRILAKTPNPRFKIMSKLPYNLDDLDGN